MTAASLTKSSVSKGNSSEDFHVIIFPLKENKANIPGPDGHGVLAPGQLDFVCVTKVIDNYLTPINSTVIYHNHRLVIQREGIY